MVFSTLTLNHSEIRRKYTDFMLSRLAGGNAKAIVEHAGTRNPSLAHTQASLGPYLDSDTMNYCVAGAKRTPR